MSISWFAVLVATLTGFVIGGVWYGPLFGRTWAAAAGMTGATLAGRNMARVFGVSAGLLFVAAVMLALFIGPDKPITFGLMAGGAAGIGWVATAFGVVYLFEARPLAQWLVNAGYFVVALTIMGGLLAAWS